MVCIQFNTILIILLLKQHLHASCDTFTVHIVTVDNLLPFCRHIDGDHKLIEPYRFVIHRGIDGYSTLILYLQAPTNNRADTMFGLFQEAIVKYNIPSRVRSDESLENIEVGRFMIQVQGTNRGSILTVSSVHNQRIE